MENFQKTHVVVVDDDDDDVDVVDGSSNPNKKQSEDEEHIGSSSESGSCSEIVKERSSVSAVDLECGAPEIKLNLAEVERDCRICHLTLDTGHLESGLSIELGCSCKDDLAAAHKQCAEAWFKIKGNNKATQHSCWKIHFEDLRLSCSCCALHNMPCYSTHANYLQLRKTCFQLANYPLNLNLKASIFLQSCGA